MEIIRKFNWRWFAMLAVVMMMGVTVSACGDDDDDDNGSDNGAYVGVWASVEDIEDGYDMVYAVKLTADGVGYDGEWDMDEGRFYPEEYSWRWSVKDGYITLTDGDESATVPFTLSDNGKIGCLGGEYYQKVQ